MPVIAEEVARRHERAYPSRPVVKLGLEPGGQYQYRSDGEYHLFNPETIHKLQAACRTGNYETFKQYAAADQRSVAQPGDAARPDGASLQPAVRSGG